MQLALEELEFFSDSYSILGVYPAHPFRHGREAAGRPARPFIFMTPSD